jgi:hypothetical protein
MDLNSGWNQQNHQTQGEQKPEQGIDAAGAPEGNPGATQSDEAGKNTGGLGQGGPGAADSEYEEPSDLGGDEGGEQQADQQGGVQALEFAEA